MLTLTRLDFDERMRTMGYRRQRKLDQLWAAARSGKLPGDVPHNEGDIECVVRDAPHSKARLRVVEAAVTQRHGSLDATAHDSALFQPLAISGAAQALVDPAGLLEEDSCEEDAFLPGAEDVAEPSESVEDEDEEGEEEEQSEEDEEEDDDDVDPDFPTAVTCIPPAPKPRSAFSAPAAISPAPSRTPLQAHRRILPAAFQLPASPAAVEPAASHVSGGRRLRGKVPSSSVSAPSGNLRMGQQVAGASVAAKPASPAAGVAGKAPAVLVDDEEEYAEAVAKFSSFADVLHDPCDFAEAMRISRLVAKRILERFHVLSLNLKKKLELN